MPTHKKEQTELQKQIAAAKAQQDRLVDEAMERATAPDGLRAEMYVKKDPLQEYMEKYAPETTGKTPTHTAFFDAEDQMKNRMAEGWVPVTSHGQVIVREGDVMFTRPRILTDQHLARVSAASVHAMKGVDYNTQALEDPDNVHSVAVTHDNRPRSHENFVSMDAETEVAGPGQELQDFG